MSSPDVYRRLAFEQLETKRAPTSLLLALAPGDDRLHGEIETALQQRQLETTLQWRHHLSTQELLRFVEQHTQEGRRAEPLPTPGAAECFQADQIMKLQDDNLRAMLIAEAWQRGEWVSSE